MSPYDWENSEPTLISLFVEGHAKNVVCMGTSQREVFNIMHEQYPGHTFVVMHVMHLTADAYEEIVAYAPRARASGYHIIEYGELIS